VAAGRLNVSEDSRDVELRVLRVGLQHEVELVAAPAIEPFLEPEPIEDLGRNRAGDGLRLLRQPCPRRGV
jgi:hypothetical protein